MQFPQWIFLRGTTSGLLVFALTALLATTLRQIGAPLEYAGYLAFVFVAGTFVFTGLFGKTMRMAHFAQADRAGNSSYTGQALATGSIAGMTYVLLAGEIYANGLDGVAWISGTVIGFAVLSFVIAPPFAGRNHQSVAGLVGHRNAPTFVNLLAALIILLISVPLLIAQLQLTSMIAEGYLNLPGPTAVITGAGVITICLILGGMQSLTISRIIFYPIIAVCFLTPLIWISLANGGGPIPQLGYGLGALSTISEIDAELLTDVYIEMLGGRQAALGLSVTETVSVSLSTEMEVVEIGARATPLPQRLSPAELEAHAALIDRIGGGAIWRKHA